MQKLELLTKTCLYLIIINDVQSCAVKENPKKSAFKLDTTWLNLLKTHKFFQSTVTIFVSCVYFLYILCVYIVNVVYFTDSMTWTFMMSDDVIIY